MTAELARMHRGQLPHQDGIQEARSGEDGSNQSIEEMLKGRVGWPSQC